MKWIQFNLKVEENVDTCSVMNELSGYFAKLYKPVTEGQILYGTIYMWYLEIRRDEK